MQVEVDQSGKVEVTQKATVLALAGEVNFSLLLSAEVKRKVLAELERRRPDRSRTMHRMLVFSTLLFLLLKDHIHKLNRIIVDVEYDGHSATIKEHVLNLFRRRRMMLDPEMLHFRRIGKKSPAHDLALKVFNYKVSPSQKVTAEEILAEFSHKKMTETPSGGTLG